MEAASTAYKVHLILDFLRPHLPPPLLSQFQGNASSSKPFLLALSGVQGCGKSTLVQVLCVALSDEGYRAISFSIDDFYLTAEDLGALRATQPENKLPAARGEPGTHEVPLANKVFCQY